MKQTDAEQLLRALFADRQYLTTEHAPIDSERASCCGSQCNLHTYLDAELEHLDAATLYPALHAQITACGSCRAAYLELKELMLLEKAGELEPPPRVANFDLSYLDAPDRIPRMPAV